MRLGGRAILLNIHSRLAVSCRNLGTIVEEICAEAILEFSIVPLANWTSGHFVGKSPVLRRRRHRSLRGGPAAPDRRRPGRADVQATVVRWNGKRGVRARRFVITCGRVDAARSREPDSLSWRVGPAGRVAASGGGTRKAGHADGERGRRSEGQRHGSALGRADASHVRHRCAGASAVRRAAPAAGARGRKAAARGSTRRGERKVQLKERLGRARRSIEPSAPSRQTSVGSSRPRHLSVHGSHRHRDGIPPGEGWRVTRIATRRSQEPRHGGLR